MSKIGRNIVRNSEIFCPQVFFPKLKTAEVVVVNVRFLDYELARLFICKVICLGEAHRACTLSTVLQKLVGISGEFKFVLQTNHLPCLRYCKPIKIQFRLEQRQQSGSRHFRDRRTVTNREQTNPSGLPEEMFIDL